MNIKSNELNEPATKGFVLEAIETVLEGMEKLLNIKFTEQEVKMNKRFDNLDNEIKWLKNDVTDLKSDAISQSEFNKLEKRVTHLETSN